MKKFFTKENIKLVSTFIITAILLLYIVIQLVAPASTVKIFGFKPYVVITESMEPVIDVRDMVIVRSFDIDDAEVGDIITFEADIDYNGSKEIVTHYIHAINSDGTTTTIQTTRHWDNMDNAVPDSWVLVPDDVLGTYWFQISKIGYVTDFLKSPFGIVSIVVNMAILGGIIYLVKKGKEQSTSE